MNKPQVGEQVHVHFYLHVDPISFQSPEPAASSALGAKIDKLTSVIEKLVIADNLMSKELDTLTQTVTDSETVQEGAIVLLGKLSELIIAAKDDPAKLQALADSLGTEKQKLADAIVANTPAE